MPQMLLTDKRFCVPTNSNETKDESYQLPVQYYNHLEDHHSISFEEYEIQTTFAWKLCGEFLILKSRRKPPKNRKAAKSPNLATAFASNWGEALRKHTSGAHGEKRREKRSLGSNLVDHLKCLFHEDKSDFGSESKS